MLGNGAVGNTNTVIVTGAGSVWTNTTLTVGNNASFNQLTIANSGLVVNTAGTIGNSANGFSNSVLVTGGSVWSNVGAIVLGNSSSGASGNSLTISAGGKVYSTPSGAGISQVGSSGGDSTVLITGPGSLWTNKDIIYVGNASANNRLVVSNSAQLISGNTSGVGSRIGNQSGADNNSVTTTGNGSSWNASSQLTVGHDGKGNQLTIANSGAVSSTTFAIGGSSGNSNIAMVTGSGSLWTNTSTTAVTVGSTGSDNQLRILDGGKVVNSGATSVLGGTGTNNLALVSGNGSSWELVGGANLNIGNGAGSYGNQLVISNQGRVTMQTLIIANNATSSGNSVLVTGNGSLLSNTVNITVGANGYGNQLTIRDGARAVNNVVTVGSAASASNNTLLVTGAGSVLENTAASTPFTIGASGSSNRMIIAEGGLVSSSLGLVGQQDASGNNHVLVTDNGSVWTNASTLTVGGNPSVGVGGFGNQLVISNGGKVYSSQGRVGFGSSTATNNSVVLTGSGSLWQNSQSVVVGSNAFGRGRGSILVEDGATLEVSHLSGNSLVGGLNGSGTISNRNAIYQFTTGNPGIVPNTAGALSISNGVIAFRDVDNADIRGSKGVGNGSTLADMSWAGNNTFRLNASSNTTIGGVGSQTYTFNTGLGPTNYTRLEMINGQTLYRNGNIAIGSGGSMLASNTVGQVTGIVTNLGTITVVNSTMTWSSNVVVVGKYTSDPSTNIFLTDATVESSGVMQGGSGDRFEFKQGFFIQSTNHLNFKLDDSSVAFTGGVLHTNTITGADLGGSNTAHDAAFGYGTNFAYGELRLGSTNDIICFLTGNSAPSNALYVGWLDLLGSTNYVANLIAPTTINVYYAADDTRNAYLGGLTYQLENHLGGTGGLLLPVIPEPSILMLLALAVCAMMRRRRGER